MLKQRILKALGTVPNPRGWAETGVIMLAFAALSLPIGLASGLLEPGWPDTPIPKLLAFAGVALFLPGFFEELFFRVLLLPHADEDASLAGKIVWGAVSLALFIASHPVNAWVLRPSMRAVFCDPAFLTSAGLLGTACTLAYWRTGSIWPPVMMHWLTVVLWRTVLGGALP
jgi:predicted Abi (CAAX) family protease